MQVQPEPRFKKRVPCKVLVDGETHAGMVLNVSRGGMFVQTSVQARPGDEVRIHLNLDSPPEAVPLGGEVVWRRSVAAHLRSVTRGGIGMRVSQAPEPYYRFLHRLAEGGSPEQRAQTRPPYADPEAPPAAPKPRYRVRMKQDGGPRSRSLTVAAASEDEARQKAKTRVGGGWSVLDLRALDEAQGS